MITSDKHIAIIMPADLAYGILGMVLNALQTGQIWGNCRTEEADIPALLAMYSTLRDDLVVKLDEAKFCEHVREGAEHIRTMHKDAM